MRKEHIELAYSILYKDVEPAQQEFALLQIACDKNQLADLSTHKKLQLVNFAISHYREGSFWILRELKEFHELIRGLKNNYYDKSYFARLLERDYHEILHALEEQAEQEVKQIHALLTQTEMFRHVEFLDLQKFCRLFGLRGYPPIFVQDPREPDSLLAKCKQLSGINHLRPIHSFFSSIMRHIQAIKEDLYKEGLKLFSVSIATRQKELAKSPTLITVLEGYKDFDVKCPIYVYDHSEEEIYTKNAHYIDKLNRQYKSHIIHVSKAECLEKIPVKGLIDIFGFGGARNCQYLLPDANMLFMVDDDMELPITAIRSAALAAIDGKNSYRGYVGFQKGRVTKSNIRYHDLYDVLHRPETLKLFPVWSDLPSWAGISECVTKPKICLNVPHGCEERHVETQIVTHYFLQPAYHLAGTRYPTAHMPTKPYVGLESYLQKSVPQALLIGMISVLVDPINAYGRCVLPWNARTDFSSLEEVLLYIARQETQDEVARRFHANCQDFFAGRYKSLYYDSIQRLLNLDVDSVALPQATTKQEKDSIKAICSLYKFFQEDAKLFWTHDKIPDEHYPLAHGFYLLERSLGKGEFCILIREYLTKNPIK